MKPQSRLPAVERRKQRIREFRQLVEANRKDKTAQQIVALYSIHSGLTPRLLNSYLKLFIQAGLYHEPNYVTGNKIVTDEEYGPLFEQYQAKRELDAKKSKYRRPRREKQYINYSTPLPDDWEEQLKAWE